jgi:hypothetical protein
VQTYKHKGVREKTSQTVRYPDPVPKNLDIYPVIYGTTESELDKRIKLEELVKRQQE